MSKSISVIGRLVTLVTFIVVIGLGFIHFTPGYSFSIIRSNSMTPTFNLGDLIVTRPLSEGIQPGMILMYQHGDDTISHRVLSVNGDEIVMKGDTLDDPDPWQVSVSAVRGVYMFRIPSIGYALSFFKTKLGWFLAILLPAALIIGGFIAEILKEAFSDDKKSLKSVKALRKTIPVEITE